MVIKMCGVQLKDRIRFKDLMFGLKEAIDQLAIANSVCWYGHVLRREADHVLTRALNFDSEGQRKKWRPKRTWMKAGRGRKCEDWFEKGRCTLPIKVECWC